MGSRALLVRCFSRALLVRCFQPLHVRPTRWPAWLQAVLAPVQAAHLHLLSDQLSDDADFESTLRPQLLPSEDWSDVDAWRGNVRLLAWLRSEAISRHPQTLRLLPPAEEALLPAGALPVLPDAATVRRLFERSRPDGSVPATKRAQRQEQQGPLGSTEGVAFSEVVHGAGGLLRGRGALNAFCERHGMYELLTQELVQGLAAHIRARLPALRAAAAAAAARDRGEEELVAVEEEDDEDEVEDVVVLEVGAGSGALTYHLREALRGERCAVLACDSRTQALPGFQFPLGERLASAAPSAALGRAPTPEGRAPTPLRPACAGESGEALLELSHAAALRRVQPSLVLCSWMPMGRDLSRAFRGCESVQEYVLLGEADDGACGDNWETWGNRAFRPSPHEQEEQGAPPAPPYQADGFARVELPELSGWMVSRYDGEGAAEACASCAVSFVRQPRRYSEPEAPAGTEDA